MNKLSAQPLINRLRTHLVLGRVSNLPTVWSNVLAGWALASSEVFVWDVFVGSFPILIAGLTLLYLGGMYLNDALDAKFDIENEIDRPIARGDIGRAPVFTLAWLFLAAGLAVIWLDGWRAFAMATGLAALIVFYNVIHKRVAWAPVVMAACRAMVYPTITIAAAQHFNRVTIFCSVVLGLYVMGLTFVARVEEKNVLKRYTPLLLTFLPAGFLLYTEITPTSVVLSGVFLIWLVYSLIFIFTPKIRNLRRAVSGMLAGICLVDLLAVSQIDDAFIWQFACLALFATSMIFQRFIPAT